MLTLIDHIDTENRQTLCEMTLAHPLSGRLARDYMEVGVEIRGWSEAQSAHQLIGWLTLVREACGLDGAGHA